VPRDGHESFEDPQIARLLNENFVNIKVDREERPELDSFTWKRPGDVGPRRLAAVGVSDASLEPFFGGTYWPAHSGRNAGFDQILQAVDDA